MNAKKRLNHIGLPRLFLIPAVAFVLIMIISNAPQSQASEGMSTQTTCVDDQPCHTVVCKENEPCNISKTPNTDFGFDADESLAQPLEGTGIMGLVPFPDAAYLDDQEDYWEERQDMMEDSEYE